jgi:hypothetical protein
VCVASASFSWRIAFIPFLYACCTYFGQCPPTERWGKCLQTHHFLSHGERLLHVFLFDLFLYATERWEKCVCCIITFLMENSFYSVFVSFVHFGQCPPTERWGQCVSVASASFSWRIAFIPFLYACCTFGQCTCRFTFTICVVHL